MSTRPDGRWSLSKSWRPGMPTGGLSVEVKESGDGFAQIHWCGWVAHDAAFPHEWCGNIDGLTLGRFPTRSAAAECVFQNWASGHVIILERMSP